MDLRLRIMQAVDAANRSQLWMWLRCEWGPSWRAFISSIMR